MRAATRLFSALLALAAGPAVLHAQETPVAAAPLRGIVAHRLVAPLRLDGRVDSTEWAGTAADTDFSQFFPFDTSAAAGQTSFRVGYDDDNLYIAIIAHRELGGGYVSQSLRRDYRGSANDGVTVVLDPWRDRTTGVFFGVNPFNVQREGLVVNGGQRTEDFDRSWDNVWTSATHIADDYWSVEMTIPFKTLRFRPTDEVWGLNVYRIDSKYNERSIWNRVPRQYQLYSLAYTGELRWEERPRGGGASMTAIPYVAGDLQRDFTAGLPTTNGTAVGMDAKIAITPAIALDLTFNPDFSQVEVDEQQTNLDRFELFFPERRQFFLENADLFATFGFPTARPFFSRRIGVAIDSSTGQNVQNRILGGARLSGRLDENWRLGVMTMQTASDARAGIDSRNYSVFAVQRQLFARSNVGFIAVRQTNTDGGPPDAAGAGDGSASQLVGVDYNLATADNRWTGKLFQHLSLAEGARPVGMSHGTFLEYNTLRWRTNWSHQIIDAEFDARTGFVPRRGFRRINPTIERAFFPSNGVVNRHTVQVEAEYIWTDGLGLTDRAARLEYGAEFRSTARANVNARTRYVKLFAPFSPTGRSDQQFAAGESFEQPEIEARFSSDPRKVFWWTGTVRTGRFFNGSIRSVGGDVNSRWRQYATVALNWDVNQVDLTNGFDDATIWRVGSRIDLTFTTTLFWTTFTQYNSQFDNLNVNSRLQWRFLPASDLFIVYTDNYLPISFVPKNRALLAKLSWWKNL